MLNAVFYLSAALAVVASANDLVGTWFIRYPWHVEVVNGVATPTMEDAEVTFAVVGDSLIATLKRSDPGIPAARRTMRLASTAARSPATFQHRDVVTASTPAGDRTMVVISTWIVNARGDTLVGTLERRLEGQTGPGAFPLSGQRIRR